MAENLLFECQRDSYARQAHGCKVVSCEKIKLSKKKSAYHIVLDNTCMYPEGGGQPGDAGVLQVKDADGQIIKSVTVEDTQKGEGSAIIHVAQEPIEVETLVDVIVSWDRRYDLMQQHTAQHLLSAIADELFKADTLSWELHAQEENTPPATVYVDVTGNLEHEQVVAIENRCNEVVRSSPRIILHALSVESDSDKLDNLKSKDIFRGSLPPPSKLQSGVVRLVEIEGVDVNACGGTHLKQLSEIQMIKLAGIETNKQGIRLKFLAGDRVMAALTGSLTREATLGRLLSCGPPLFEKNVSGAIQEKKALLKANKEANKELAQLFAKNLMGENEKICIYTRPEEDTNFLSLVAGAVREIDENRVVFGVATGGSQPSFLLTGPPAVVSAVGKQISTQLEGRGGGRDGRFQGKAKHATPEDIAAVKEILSSA